MTPSEGEALAKEKSFIFQEVSARSGSNINNLFYKDIFSQISKKYKLLGEEGNDNGEQNQNKSKIIFNCS